MITLHLQLDSQSQVQLLRCQGHAGFDDGEGLDLVCAAVSALTGALGLGLCEKLQPPLKVSGADGWFELDLRQQKLPPEGRLLVETIAASLRSLCDNYPGFIELRALGEE